MANQWLFQTENSHQENDDKTKLEELFVFGYACKIFRDDSEAKMVDAGKYMIPWMDDDRLRIDRYDGRGHLYDLSEYDADQLKGRPAPELTDDEKRIEKFCEEERYLELHTNLAEKTMYEEEEWKRYYESLSEGYKAVGFSYDYYGQPQTAYTETEAPKENPEDLAFVPSPELHVPADTQLPSTVKHNNIIEKTAKFIAEHGIQMEIMMKTKQANNEQFSFMHFEDPLHPYYRHVVQMIKSKKYTPKSQETDEDKEEALGEANGHSYLHPTLMTSNRASPTPEVEKPVAVPIPKVSIHETSYGQLLQSLSRVNNDIADRLRPKTNNEGSRTDSPEPTMLPACMAQPGSTPGGLPLPPGIEPVTLPSSADGDEDAAQPEPRTEIHVDEAEVADIVPPPPDLQPVIDRMAMYVARNGIEFEIVVKSKNDQRFQFLQPWHMHFQYYDFKKNLFTQELEKTRKVKEKEEKLKANEEETEKAAAAANKGVKFKVKAKDTEQKSVIDNTTVFEYETSDEENTGESDGQKDKSDKGDTSRRTSRTATPVKSLETKPELPPEVREKMQAEQRMKDRLAQTSREKLTQVKREEQLKAERKRKAALFINMLKGAITANVAAATANVATANVAPDDTPASASTTATPSESGTNTPVEKESSTKPHKAKSKHKHRSRSRSRSPSKKKQKRGPTLPSAYAVVRRSPLRRPPPPPPPRNHDLRRERSLSGSRSSRHRSRSPSSRSKSKKKKRSRSPKSRTHRHKRSSKKKKKRSRSPHRKSSRKDRNRSKSVERSEASVPATDGDAGSRVGSPVAMDAELEEGEARDSSPEPGEIPAENTNDRVERLPSPDPNPLPKSPSRSRSRSISRISQSRSRSKSQSVSNSKSRSRSRSKSTSPSKSRSRSHSRSKSRSRSRSRSNSSDSSDHVRSRTSPSSPASRRSRSPVNSVSRSGFSTPDRLMNGGESNENSQSGAAIAGTGPKKDISTYMLSRVRAMIKASHEAILQEDREEHLLDDP